MSKKPFDYSKWDNIELSDDEDDVHPNIDKESWFRMKHRSRVEREDNEEKDKQRIRDEMNKANERIAILQHELKRFETIKQDNKSNDDDDDDDEDLDAVEKEGYITELQELQSMNQQRQKKLDEYDKNKKWNVDNMSTLKEERTIVNPNAAKPSYNPTSGYVEHPLSSTTATTVTSKANPSTTATTTTTKTKSTTAAVIPTKNTASTKSDATAAKAAVAGPQLPPPSSSSSSSTATSSNNRIHNVPSTKDLGAMATYHEFTEKYADVVEGFMKCTTLEESKEYLLQYGNIVLCENASNYLLLASLEDEMNGYRDKMKLTARQSQIVSNIAELAKTVQQHPGNVIQPFFHRLMERKHLEEFLHGVSVFVEKIIQRAIVKKAEIDEQRRRNQQHGHDDGDDDDDEEGHDHEGGGDTTSLHDVPREQRLGPGGLDPLEVIETLPEAIVAAFESRDVNQLKDALMTLSNEEAEYHMQRCIDSGLWVANANES